MKQNTMFKIIGSFMILLTILSVVNATTISNSLSTFTSIIDMGTQQIYNITNVNATNLYATVVNATNLFIGTTKVNASNLLPLSCTNNTVGKYDTATGTWLCQSDTDTTINVTSIQVTGTGTKTLTLEQLNGIANRTTSWTDIDTTYTNGTGLNLTSTTFYLDLNYVDGVYVKRNTWTTIDNYPSGCSAGQYISTIGDTLTCSAPADLNFNVSSIQFTGTTTKTLNLEQIGIANRTATFTDIDTDTNNYPSAIQFTGTGTKTLNLERSGLANLTATFSDTDTTYSNTTGLTLSGTTFGLDLPYANSQYVARATWTTIDNYPTGCSAGQYVSTIGDTLTCGTPTDTNTNDNVSSIQFTGTGVTKTLTLEQTGGNTNKTTTFTDLTNSSADMIFAVNNTAGKYTFQGLNISTTNINMNAQNITFAQGTGVILNNSQAHTNLFLNSSGCVVLQGATGSISVC